MRFDLEDFKERYNKPKTKKMEDKDPKLIEEMKAVAKNIVNYGFECRNEKVFWSTARFIARHKLDSAEKGLIFVGTTGTGKTMACELLSAFHWERETNTPIEGNFFKAKLLEKDYIGASDKKIWYNFLKRNNTVIIDDLGDESTISDFGHKFELLADIITLRYDLFKSSSARTIITTNLTGDQIRQRYSERVYSRIREMCEIVNSNGEDQRLK